MFHCFFQSRLYGAQAARYVDAAFKFQPQDVQVSAEFRVLYSCQKCECPDEFVLEKVLKKNHTL